MKKVSIALAVALFSAMTAPAFASCDTRKEDDQAVCAGKCEDSYVRHKQDMMADHARRQAVPAPNVTLENSESAAMSAWLSP